MNANDNNKIRMEKMLIEQIMFRYKISEIDFEEAYKQICVLFNVSKSCNGGSKFQTLIKCLCTEEMIDNGTAIKVKAKSKIGYLLSYDAELGFGMWTEHGDNEYELGENEIEILN